MKTTLIKIEHVFAETIPDVLKDGKLYVSFKYNTAVHKCACGCGEEVVTTISPSDWKIIYNGETISLHPSIGNWSYRCRSHYWIRGNRIEWAEDWTDAKVKSTRESSKKSVEVNKKTSGKKQSWLDRFINGLLK